MAEDGERGERTEEATPQRREEFRKRGQVAQTRELATVFVLLSSFVMIWLLGRFFLVQLQEVLTTTFKDYIVHVARGEDWMAVLSFAGGKLVLLLAPVLALMWVISVTSTLVQVGFLYNEEALEWKIERLDPLQGFKRIFSLKNVVEGLKALGKLLVIGFVTWMILRSEIYRLPYLVEYSVGQMLVYLGDVIGRLLLTVGILMAVLAGLDFLFQRWDLEKQMMMSKQEIKEEIKSREGDPMIRARIKRIQREIAGRRMMEKVPQADVIITNPTHIAVALKYDSTMVAPQLLAKGGDFLAEKIKTLAREHHVPIVENKPLARTIYKTIKIGQQIPRELYTAVAEVLAFVYRLKKKVS